MEESDWGWGGSEDLSKEVTSDLIFDRQGGVGNGKLQGAVLC